LPSEPSTANRVSKANRWGDTQRYYEINGVHYPSVTTIIGGAVNKPALVPWSAKVEREAVSRAAGNLWDDVKGITPPMTREAFLASLQTRVGKQKAHVKELEKASNIGSQVHALIEWNMRKEMGQLVGPEPPIGAPALMAFGAYEEWRKTAGLMPRLIEQVVWSTRHGYAGTLDLYAGMDHEGQQIMAVTDYKTGRAIYAEAFLQIAAYAQALVEMEQIKPPVSGCIVRLPKLASDPLPEVRILSYDEMVTHFQAFLSVLEVWKWMEAQK